MARRKKDDDFGLKKSSGVNYAQVLDRHVDDERFERQRAIRAAGAAPPPAAVQRSADVPVGAKKPSAQSATMDAFMRMVTGKEERTIADRISDPNRPTWEQFKRENADKLDLLGGNEEKEMVAYRKKLDAAREKALAKRSGSSKKARKRRSRSSSPSSESDTSDSSDGGGRRRSSKKRSSRKKKKSKKRRRSSSSDSESASESEDSDARTSSRKKHKHKSKKKKKKSKTSSREREHSPSPVRLSSFFNHGGSSDED